MAKNNTNGANLGFENQMWAAADKLRGQTLFIDARQMGSLIDRTHKDFSEKEIDKIAKTYHAGGAKKMPASIKTCPVFAKAPQPMRSKNMAMS